MAWVWTRGPVDGMMLAIPDMLSMQKFVEFGGTSDLKLVGLSLLECSWGPSLVLLDPWGSLGTPLVGVTTVGPKDVLVLGPSLNKIQRSSLGKSRVFTD